MESTVTITVSNTPCRCCGSTTATVQLTPDGWQCTDVFGCLSRWPEEK